MLKFFKEILDKDKLKKAFLYRGYDLFSRYSISAVFGVAALMGLEGAGATWTLATLYAPIAAGAMLATNFITHRLHEHALLNSYREEIADITGVLPRDVTRKELYKAAESNLVLKEALDHYRSNSHIAKLIHLATIGLLVGTLGVAIPVVSQLFSSATSVSSSIAEMGFGFGSIMVFNQLNRAVCDTVKVFYNLQDPPQGHGKIVEIGELIEKGGKVPELQVFAVFANANPLLNDAIKQQFNRSYDQLTQQEKLQAFGRYGAQFHMVGVAEALNEGRLIPHRLAYVSALAPERLQAELEARIGKPAMSPPQATREPVAAASLEHDAKLASTALQRLQDRKAIDKDCIAQNSR